jgi:hypothetical protein
MTRPTWVLVLLFVTPAAAPAQARTGGPAFY